MHTFYLKVKLAATLPLMHVRSLSQKLGSEIALSLTRGNALGGRVVTSAGTQSQMYR